MRMRKNNKYITAIVLCIGISMLFTGCKSKQIFKVEGSEYTQKTLTKEELLNNTYYIKDGTKFIKTYFPEKYGTVNVSGDSGDLDVGNNKVLWLRRDYSLIPSYYENELIAYPSETPSLENISIERFEEVGTSIGLYGAVFNSQTGYIDFTASYNIVESSDLNKKINNGSADTFQLVNINDEPVTNEMLNSHGIITGLEKDKVYKIGYYIGTRYATADVIADNFFIQSYETYAIDTATLTKNGYLSIQMPKDAKSGYYAINNSGLFKYYNYSKGDFADDEQDMNEPYYRNAQQQLSLYTQQYVASVEKKTKDVQFDISYDSKGMDKDDIIGILSAPDENTYKLTNDTENNKLVIQLKEAIAGRWTINVAPKELVVTDIKISSSRNADESVMEKKEFIISEADENVMFYAKYKGTGTVWGIIENENNEAQDMIIDEDEQILYYTYPYLEAGTYKITIYHYADTEVTEINFKYNEANQQTEIITVEE